MSDTLASVTDESAQPFKPLKAVSSTLSLGTAATEDESIVSLEEISDAQFGLFLEEHEYLPARKSLASVLVSILALSEV